MLRVAHPRQTQQILGGEATEQRDGLIELLLRLQAQREQGVRGRIAGVLLNLGLNALDAGDALTALGWLERALRQAPLDAEIRTYAAAAAFETGDLGRARELLGGALRWQEAEAVVLAEAAWLLFRLDETRAAEDLLHLALARDPQHYSTWQPDPAAPDAAASPVFVVGFPRSGTTLLETMLDAHPALAC
ncbi:MAG TPA: sulfotransferase, partial [Tahibacter sp.]|nr:sulfotransferase [Tahibacter sp.]